ncbi:MAG: hypothetical protein KF862_23115 [Chitinophagaceae bacterium]|nr:hypothetical protein [Chitinophagaceae bacterium]
MISNLYKIAFFTIVTFPFLCAAQPPKIIPVDSLGKETIRDTNWMSNDDNALLKSVKLNYEKLPFFDEVKAVECFKNNIKLEAMFRCLAHKLESRDKEVIVFLSNHFLTKFDSINLRQSFPRMFIPDLNSQHIYEIRAQILYYLEKDATLFGENMGFNWKQYVRYYTSKESKRIFNADTAISYFITLKDKEAYEGKYQYMQALFLQKKDRGFAQLYGFYTDKSKKKLSKYWRKIEGIFKYED